MINILTEPTTILVFESNDTNNVPFLTYDEPLDYVYYGISNPDALDVGMLYDENLDSFEEFKNIKRENFKKNLEADLNELLNDIYFDGTRELAREFHYLAQDYLKKRDDFKLKGKNGYNYLRYTIPFNNFYRKNAFLQKGYKGILDVRFKITSETLTGEIDGEPFEEIVAKEPPIYSREDFKKAVNEEANKFKVTFENNLKETEETIKQDFEDLKHLVKKYLTNHKKVGLIGYNTSGKCEEINDLSLDEFGVEGFLKVKPNTIYRFTK